MTSKIIAQYCNFVQQHLSSAELSIVMVGITWLFAIKNDVRLQCLSASDSEIANRKKGVPKA